VGAADRGGSAAREDASEGVATDDHGDLRRHQNGTKWRSIPAELGPCWLAAQLFIRWSKFGVWERLLELVQQRRLVLGMTFLDGTNIRAHQKAAGAKKGGATARSETYVRRLAALAAATAPKPA
jgi:transposase